MKQWKHMSASERLEWGRIEQATRMKEMRVSTQAGLDAVRKAQRTRRELIGASESQVADVVLKAAQARSKAK